MISYSNFRLFLEKYLLDPLFIIPQFYFPNHSTSINDLVTNSNNPNYSYDFNGNCVFWHEEPLNTKDLTNLSNGIRQLQTQPFSTECRDWYDCEIPSHGPIMYNVNIKIFANSEKSQLKKQWLKANQPFLDWYFFFHGFVALDWYRELSYLQNVNNFKISKIFICLNHIINDNRSYRMLLISMLKENNLAEYGIISAPLLNQSIVKEEIFNNHSKLSNVSKKHIIENLWPAAAPMIIDDVEYASASAFIPDYFYTALWNIVTETNFYDEKLHLTEKIFKPIVTKRPFILVSSPGNLAYLKSYGFKTFDKWIDESYDCESDHDLRLKMIVHEIKKLCRLSESELDKMYQEMQSVLEYNHRHFYTEFKKIIVNELIDNFESCVKIYNLGLSERFRVPSELVDYNKVKAILMR
jgi:hypothetical protein